MSVNAIGVLRILQEPVTQEFSSSRSALGRYTGPCAPLKSYRVAEAKLGGYVDTLDQANLSTAQKMSLAKAVDRETRLFFILGLGLLVVGAVILVTPPDDMNRRFSAYFVTYGFCAPVAGVLSLWVLRLSFYDRWSGFVSILCSLVALAFVVIAAEANVSIMLTANAAKFWMGAAFGFILFLGIILEARQLPRLGPVVIPIRIFAVGIIILSVVATALVESLPASSKDSTRC